MTDTIVISYKKESPLDVRDLEKEYQDAITEFGSDQHTFPSIPVVGLEKGAILPQYNPFRIRNIQNYNPIYSRFFELTEHNYNKITLNQTYGIRGLQLVHRETGKVNPSPIFFKFAPLLDPIRYMIGKYDITDPAIRTLPTLTNNEGCLPKLSDVNNVSYVDSFFCYLSSQLLAKHNVYNALDFYGSYLGIQELFRVNVSDLLDYLQSSPFYTQHLNRDFYVEQYEYSNYNNGSKTNRQRIQIQNNTECSHISLGAEILDTDTGVSGNNDANTIPTKDTQNNRSTDSDTNTMENNTSPVYERKHNATRTSGSGGDSSRDSLTTDNSQDLNYTSDEDDDEEEDDEDNENNTENRSNTSDADEYETDSAETEETDEPDDLYAYIRDFPTQMICIEKCNGALDDLLAENKLNDAEITACLFQVIMTLVIYRNAFQFIHNDLHTNNIMYTNTDAKYVYYRFQSQYYRVPTYGRIFKIIDFGRAIYRFHGHSFCSDSFDKCGDAYTQYNCEPFMNKNKPRIDPNPSFDLCRLGCSMYDFVFDNLDDENGKMSVLQKTILRWCTDDNGKNVLYKKSFEQRYRGFKLYKMIARNVHRHTPEAQLSFPEFSQFAITKKNLSKYNAAEVKRHFVDIDSIPNYVNMGDAAEISRIRK